MALYDREQTKSFYSEIAHEQDICFYCEKAVQDKRKLGKITLDEMHKELKLLRGKLASKRVMKFRYVGHDFCVCPECITNIHNEICQVKPSEAPVEQADAEPVMESSTEEESIESETEKKTKGKGKGKASASK